MEANAYQQVKELFCAACQLSAGEQAQYLDRACQGDDDLRRHVERMLAADDRAPGFLDTPLLADSPLRHAMADPESESIPSHIGRYRILRLIGEGGMGYVYEAEQDSPRRIVALKVIRAALPSKRMVQRFEREIEILGRLQHPNIAQIYDAGLAVVPSGGGRALRLPFYAMEFIDGLTLTEYATGNQLSDRQCLELLATLCDAIDYGHYRGIVHRDLKPGNVLVESPRTGEGVGHLKVIDFGVARAANLDQTIATLNTHSGMLIGTLAYMSPEQVSGREINDSDSDHGSTIDSRSDVYSLGVIGYELLARRLPYDIAGRSVPDAARVICDEDPSSLSSISRTHRGDVQTILCRAMAKEPGRRYQSAAEMAADIRRFLCNQPIMARPPSLRYQLAKFARRHKEFVAGLVLVFVMLVAGIIGTTVAMVGAEREASRARVVNDVLQRILGFARPGMQGGGRDVLVVEMLDAAAADLESYLQDAPDLELIARKTLGETYQQLGLYAKAVSAFERASELAVQIDPESADAFECQARLSLCRVHAAAISSDMGQFQEIVTREAQIVEPLLPEARRLFGSEHQATQHLLATFGIISLKRWHADEEAEVVLRELLEILQQLPPDRQAIEPPIVMSYLAHALSLQWKNDEAEHLARIAVESEGNPATLTRMAEQPASSVLATCAYGLGRLDEAEMHYRNAIELQVRALGSDHPAAVHTKHWLARLLMARHEWEEPLRLWEFQRRYWESASPSSGWIGHLLMYEGDMLDLLNRPGEARERYDAAIAHFLSIDNRRLAWDVRCEAELRLGLGALQPWEGAAIRDSFRSILRPEVFRGGSGVFEIGTLDWDHAQFTMTSWTGAGDLMEKSLHHAIGVNQLHLWPDPPRGVYEITAIVPRTSREPLRRQSWVLFTEWELQLQSAKRVEGAVALAPNIRAGPIEERTVPALMLSDWFADGFGPRGANVSFEIHGRATVDVPPGRYRMVIDADDGIRAWIDGEQLIDHWTSDYSQQVAEVEFIGEPREIRIEYFQLGIDSRLWVRLEPVQAGE